MKMRQSKVKLHTVHSAVASDVGADGLIGPIGNGSRNKMHLSRLALDRRGAIYFRSKIKDSR
jgi:hypothetical protein